MFHVLKIKMFHLEFDYVVHFKFFYPLDVVLLLHTGSINIL